MTDVPSNLIPTRITQLPVAPVADEDSLMMIVYQGNNYQIRVGDLLAVAGVPITTQVIAGTAMTGGGALSGNVTLSVAGGGIGTTQLANSGVTAGVYGTATDIPVFTVDATGRVMAATTIPATISGYVPTTRQVIAGTGLTGGGALNANVTLAADLSSSTPLTGFQSGSAGSATTISRSDHTHPQVDLSDDDQVDNLLGLNNGGTAKSLVAAAGAIVWSGADGLYIGPVGSSGQVLVSGGTGAPTWGSALLVVDQAANVVYAGPTAGPAAPTAFRALVNADLPASGVSANTYGSSSLIPVITVNAQGVITSASTTAFGGGTVSSVDVSGGTTGLTTSGGPITTSGTITLAGTLAIASGGSGQTTAQAAINAFAGAVTSGSYLRGNGTNVVINTIQAVDVPTLNQNTTGTAANVTGIVAIANGGTNSTATATAGGVGYGTGTAHAYTAAGTAAQVLTSNGASAPTWGTAATGTVTNVAQTFTGGIVAVAGSPITTSGTLALTVAGTSGGVPYFSSASTWATSAALVASALVIGGGAGVAPSTVTTGTGVVTALGVNTGSSGAFVVNGGALGTPSSGTLTNTTGLPLTTGVTGTLPIANGGTNSTATATAGGAGYGTGTAHAYTTAGTAGQVLTSAGASAPTWSGISGGTF